MNVLKKYASAALAAVLFTCLLTGCGKEKEKDTTVVQEAAESFLEAVKTGDENGIKEHATSEVANGYFVTLFNAKALEEQFTSNLDKASIRDDTQAKMDEFYNLYTSMMEEYTITDVAYNEDGTATAHATMKTSFPIDVITSDDAKLSLNVATSKYNEENMDEIVKMRKDDGEDVAFVKISNDLIIVAMDVYEDIIASSSPMTYALELTMTEKKEEDQKEGTWLVSEIKDYDINAAGAAASASSDASKSSGSTTDIPTTSVSFEKLEDLESGSGASN
ncbi:MAG: hypothetical protein K6E91_11910 [Butyrivibrio sp.]|nr:hypothetical protein [Butyrivibrio sp.]